MSGDTAEGNNLTLSNIQLKKVFCAKTRTTDNNNNDDDRASAKTVIQWNNAHACRQLQYIKKERKNEQKVGMLLPKRAVTGIYK